MAHKEQPQKKSGCLSNFFIGLLIFFFISGFLPGGGKDSNTTDVGVTTNTTQKATAKATKTPRPTATPKPTATPVPDFSSMTLEQTVDTLAEYFCKDEFVLTKKSIINGGVAVDIKVESFIFEKWLVRDCCRVYLNMAREMFKNSKTSTFAITFETPGRDKYGNETMVTAVEILLTRETANKLNFEYMISNLGASTKTFLQVANRYYVHKDLQSGVY